MTWRTIRKRLTLSFNEIELTGELQYDSSQHALTLVFDGGDSEALSVDLLSSGYVAFPDEVFVKDYSEHSGLRAALVETEVCEAVGEVILRPFDSCVCRMRTLI